MRLLLSNLTILSLRAELIFCDAAQRIALPVLGRGRRSRPTGKMLRRVKLLEICEESPASGARFVGQAGMESYFFFILNSVFSKK
jgi:hypothetical protein